jgi:uncharacterized Zn-binding protein involved in type VI secretion|tara:strand:+ start:288 stop:590 length:303 start_codon:yes stop_codon:yes gene_type:complete
VGKPITFFGAADLPHCSDMTREGKSPNVLINPGGVAKGVSRQGDNNTSHVLPPAPCSPHQAAITTGSLKVKINGKGCGRIADAISGCTKVAEGYIKVIVG